MTPATGTNVDALHQSYGRCLRNGRFVERFYDILLDSHPDVRAAFAVTDFDRQRRLLRRTLTTSIMFAAGSDIVVEEVNRMAQIHSRRGKAPVQPFLYAYWLESLMQTIAEHDPELTPELKQSWRDAMGCIIKHFSAQY